MAKPVTQPQFDALLERRVNIIARAIKDQIGTTENNPQHLDEATAEKVISYLEGVIGTLKANFEATLTRSAPATIATFSLGKKPVTRAAKPKAERSAVETLKDLASAVPAKTEEVERRHAVPVPSKTIEVIEEALEELVVETPIPETPVIKQAVVKPAPKKPAPAPVVEKDELDELDELDALLADD